jgi:histidinol-phosphate aminotransferase
MGPAPKSSILEIEPYVPGKARAAGFQRPVKLSANENGLGASPAARAAYMQAATSVHAYPDPNANALREALAARHDLDPARIVFGNGSDELFSLACQAFLNPGDNIVQPQYAFAAWAIAARAAGGEVKSAPELRFTVDVDAMLAQVDSRTRIVFLANPANPTGTCLPFSEVRRLHAGLPETVLFVLDGAYAEFARRESGFGEDLALARDAPNVLATRTFSKLYGLAGLRIGWGYASRDIAGVLNRIRLPFNTSAAAQAAALAALGDDAFVETSISHAEAARAELTAFFSHLNLEPIRPSANFVSVRIPETTSPGAKEIEERLAARGILVRWLGNYGMPDALRITAGDAESLQCFRQAFADVLQTRPR